MIRVHFHVKHRLLLCSFGLMLAGTPLASGGTVRVHQAPAGEELSKDYVVQVQGQEVPVYSAKVASAEPARRWKAMDDKGHSGALKT